MSSVCPLPSTPRDTDDLARLDRERDSTYLLDAALVSHVHVFHAEERLARLPFPLLDPQQHLATHHQLREPLLGRTRDGKRLDELAAAQHSDAIGDLEHLVQLVADEDDRHALAREVPEDGEQLDGLLRCENCRRLVEDEDVRPPVERLQDFDALLLAHGDVLDESVGVDGEAEAGRELADLSPCHRVVSEKIPCSARLERRS